MKNTFPKIPFLLSIIFFIFSVAVFVFFFRLINERNEESQIKEEKWQKETDRRDEIKALDYSVKIIEEERKVLDRHFAKSSDVVPFLDTIEELAPQVGAKANVTSVDIIEENGGLMIGMQASGAFGSLYRFITLLENSPYELEFMAVSIKRQTVSSAENKSIGSPNWEAILKIKLLSFVD